MNLIAPYLSNVQVIKMAWKITGGWAAALKSADFAIAVVVWCLCIPFWNDGHWWEQVISVLPNLLGFTLGGFAIFLGFGSESFKTLISDADEMKSPYISVSAAFLMFVFFQMLALLYAFAAKSLHFPTPVPLLPYAEIIRIADLISSGVGYMLFVYSLIFALRASMRIFRLSRWYHHLIVVEAADRARATSGPGGSGAP